MGGGVLKSYHKIVSKTSEIVPCFWGGFCTICDKICGTINRTTNRTTKIPWQKGPYSTVYLALPDKKSTEYNPKNWQVQNIAHTHNTQHNTQKQDEPLPLYHPQQLCPISPWQHLKRPQIMVPRLPTSLLQAPGGGFALAAAGSLGWDAKQRCIKKKRGGWVLDI